MVNENLNITYELTQTKVQDQAAKKSEKSLKKLTAASVNTQMSMMAAAGAAVGAIAAISGAMFLTVGAASKFEESFAGIRKTVDGSETDFKNLATSVRNLAQDIPVTTSALNQIGELGGQLGISIEGLENFIETIAKLGVATRLSTESAALGLARLSEIFQLPEGDIDNLASSLVDLGNNFAALEDEILSTALRLAAGAKVAGATVSDVLGIATALQAVGVQSQAGGTAMARVFQQIQIAASSGGKQLATFVDVTGLSVQAFQELAREDPAQVLNIFVTSLAKISSEGGNAVAILDDLGLKQQRTIRALLAVGEAGDLLVRTLVTAETAFETNIALTEEAEKRFETFKSQTKLLMNEINELRIQIGNKLLPTAKALVSVFSAIVNAFQNADSGSTALSGALKILNVTLIATASAMAVLTTANRLLKPVLVENALTMAQLTKAVKANELANITASKGALQLVKIHSSLAKALPIVGVALAALTGAFAFYKRSQEKANEAAEEFIQGRVASVSITQKVIDKEKELQDALQQGDVSDARLNFLQLELDAIKEIEERIQSATIKDFFQGAGLGKMEAEQASEALVNLGEEVSNFFDDGVIADLKINFQDEGLDTFGFVQAEKAIVDLDAELVNLDTSFSELVKSPNELLSNLALLEMQGIPAFALLDDVIGGVNQAVIASGISTAKFTDENLKALDVLRKEAVGLDLVSEAFGQVNLKGDALKEVIEADIKAFNELEENANKTEITFENVINDFSIYIDILQTLSGESEDTAKSQEELIQAAFDLSDKVTDNIAKINQFTNALKGLQRIAPMSLNQILEGFDRLDNQTIFLKQKIIELAREGFLPLAVGLSEMEPEESIGLLLALSTATNDEIQAIQDSVVGLNADLANLNLSPEQIDNFIDDQENTLKNFDLAKQFSAGIVVEAEAQLAKQQEINRAAVEVVQIVRSEQEARENIAELQDKIAEMQQDLVAGGISLTQQQIRQVDLLEAQEGFAKAIRDFGKEGVITNAEELDILNQQMAIQRMRDKLEGKMSNRDKKRIRDKEKEVKFLKMAVEQGVAEQLDLDVAQDELDDLKKPLSDADREILDLELAIAEAELKVAEAQAERLNPAVVSAMESLSTATSSSKKATDDLAEAESNLAKALIDANIAARDNEIRIKELLIKYPELKGAVTDLANDIGIPLEIANSVLDGLDVVADRYQQRLDDMVAAGQAAQLASITAFLNTQPGFGNNPIVNMANIPSPQQILQNLGITPQAKSGTIGQIGSGGYYTGRRMMDNYTGGNVPVGRVSLVGERGPEVIMSTPAGTSVFSNKTGAGVGGTVVQNMNVNITGLPADPISARKAAMNIRRELNKLEKEGTAGTGLRNR